jgi:NTE family protein
MRINAVFEGGGVKGMALVGALAAAEQRGLRIHQVAGTSAGAMVAACVAAGYSSAELKDILGATSFRQFLQPSRLQRWLPGGAVWQVTLRLGLYSAQPLEQWLAQLLAQKGVFTFADLPPGKLRVIASDLSLGKLLVLPDDLATYECVSDTFSVARAVSMSFRIPYFFEPARLCQSLIVDGALLSNFPVWLFDAEQRGVHDFVPTIGFQLRDRSAQHVAHRIRGPLSMLTAMFGTMMNAHDKKYIADEQQFRTVVIPTDGVQPTQFDISRAQRLKLYESGYVAGEAFFRNWDTQTYHRTFAQQAAIARRTSR